MPGSGMLGVGPAKEFCLNKVGIYYAYWTREWDVDFVPYLTKAKTLGFDVLEINAGTVARMTAADRDRLKAAAADAGIELTFCVGLPAQFDVASDDAAVRDAGVAYLQEMARSVGGLGGRVIGGITYGSWPGKPPAGVTDRRPFLDRSVASMRRVMPAAADAGVTFCMEVVNRFEQFMLNTAAEAVAYVDRVDSPHCRVMLDSFHMNIEEDDMAAALRTAAPVLAHFHVGETNRRPPGRGRMPWGEIFGALASIGYGGAVTMEPFVEPGGQVGRDISVYRDLTDGRDPDAEAARAAAFVREHLKADGATPNERTKDGPT